MHGAHQRQVVQQAVRQLRHGKDVHQVEEQFHISDAGFVAVPAAKQRGAGKKVHGGRVRGAGRRADATAGARADQAIPALVGLPAAADHPARSEPVHQRAIRLGPERLLQRHGHRAAGGQLLEHALRIRHRGVGQRQRHALLAGIRVPGGRVAAHQGLLVQGQPCVHDAFGIVGGQGGHGGVGRGVGVADHGFDPAAQHALVEVQGLGAVAVEAEVGGELGHGVFLVGRAGAGAAVADL
ncbi:hypothetical protein G6F31_014847 [Rhizopus arrhizus]|nr:hypothetical protein G6F31_014847 [Rhizopus arrhizus]